MSFDVEEPADISLRDLHDDLEKLYKKHKKDIDFYNI